MDLLNVNLIMKNAKIYLSKEGYYEMGRNNDAEY